MGREETPKAHRRGAPALARLAATASVRPARKEKGTTMSRSTTPNSTKAKTLASLKALVSGLQQQFPSGSFTLESTAYTTQSLITFLGTMIDALQALDAAQLNAKAAVSAAKAALANGGPTASALRRQLLSMFGNAAQMLAIFGLQLPKAKAPRTSEQLAVAAAKARSTRRARGTASKKLKATIKGNVVGVQVTPITAPTPAAPRAEATPPSPSVQPVPAAPAASSTGTAGK